jgi:hypothetical protein
VAHISLPYHTQTTSVSMEMFVFFLLFSEGD